MFDLTYGTALNRKSIKMSLSKTPKQAMDELGVNYSKGVVHLDGVTLDNASMNKTFEQLGIKDKATLMVVVKADAAC